MFFFDSDRLSPVINPVFGTAMGAGTLPIAWTAKKWYNAKAKGTGGWINQTVDFWQTVSHPDYVKRTREITRKRGELNRIINRTLNASPVDDKSLRASPHKMLQIFCNIFLCFLVFLVFM
mgnify:CR=1 FL=1